MDRYYEIKSIEQAKVLAHDLRMNVIKLFNDETPRTAKQIADEFGMPASKVHYHVKELARVGLLNLVRTEENKGIIEKYYLPVAKLFKINISKSNNNSKDFEQEKIELIINSINEFRDGYINTKNRKNSSLSFLHVDLTNDELEVLNKEIKQILVKFENRKKDSKTRKSYNLLMGIYEENKGEE